MVSTRSTRVAVSLITVCLTSAPARAQLADIPEEDDTFGSAVTVGDFNGDGYDDLVIGVPGESIDAIDGAGAAHVIYGSPGGPVGQDEQFWHQNSPGIGGVAEADDLFGSALAAGDFDGDGFDDLAVGSPGEAIGAEGAAGLVNVIHGSPSGLTSAGSKVWHQDTEGMFGSAEAGDSFGAALATGDFDDDGWDDLAIGVKWEDLAGKTNPGFVHVLYGTTDGLSTVGSQAWSQEDIGFVSHDNEIFGFSLATGDFDGDGYHDLAVGAPGEQINEPAAGSTYVIHGSATGLASAGVQRWHRAVQAIAGDPEAGERFGWSLAAGDLDDDGVDDLAVGVPFHSHPDTRESGTVHVIYGTPAGLSVEGNQLWAQDSPGIGQIPETFDLFGFALAAGDVDGDGIADLAIGARGESIGNAVWAGAVTVLTGTSSGLTGTGSRTWSQGSDGVGDVIEGGDWFGSALAAGDFNGDGDVELAVGAAREDIEAINAAGAVNILAAPLDEDDPFGTFLHQGGPILVAAPEPASSLAAGYVLAPASPNPFRTGTALAYELAEDARVRVSVFDALGRRVAVLLDATRRAGRHRVGLDPATLPSGTYFVRLEANGARLDRRVTLLR